MQLGKWPPRSQHIQLHKERRTERSSSRCPSNYRRESRRQSAGIARRNWMCARRQLRIPRRTSSCSASRARGRSWCRWQRMPRRSSRAKRISQRWDMDRRANLLRPGMQREINRAPYQRWFINTDEPRHLRSKKFHNVSCSLTSYRRFLILSKLEWSEEENLHS